MGSYTKGEINCLQMRKLNTAYIGEPTNNHSKVGIVILVSDKCHGCVEENLLVWSALIYKQVAIEKVNYLS